MQLLKQDLNNCSTREQGESSVAQNDTLGKERKD
jgi:hypothetical protein